MNRLACMFVGLLLILPGSAKAQELLFNPGFEDLGGGVEVNGGVYNMTAVAPAGAAFVRPIVRYDNVGSSGGQMNVFVFDASLTVVPELNALLLGGCAVACYFVTHRRE